MSKILTLSSSGQEYESQNRRLQETVHLPGPGMDSNVYFSLSRLKYCAGDQRSIPAGAEFPTGI